MIGDALMALRQGAGLTQEALAERAGISVRGLRKLESGLIKSPRQSTLDAIADALGVSGDDVATLLAPPAARSVSGARALLIPRQLPPRPALFVGRGHEMATMDKLLSPLQFASGSSVGPGVVTLSGPPGVGKTALAVEWGHRAARQFPDGQLFLNLRGHDGRRQPLAASEALQALLVSLGVPPAEIGLTFEARLGQYRTQVADRRVLVVLDNAAESDQLRPLLPAGPGSVTIVTSRRRLTGIVAESGAVPIRVGMLSPQESRQMVTRRLLIGGRQGEVSDADVEPLVNVCSGLPLALAIVASRAQLEVENIQEFVTRVAEAERGLSILTTADSPTSLETLLLDSVDSLSDDAQRCFLELGLGTGPEISVAEVGSLHGCPRDQAQALLEELLDASLVQMVGVGRVGLHDLVWEFVVERSQVRLPSAEILLSRKRLLDYLIYGAAGATARFAPHLKGPTLPDVANGVVLEEFRSADEARDWMSIRVGAALVAIRHGISWGFPREVALLAEVVHAFLDISGNWDHQAAAATAALRAGESLGDKQIEALALRRLAVAQVRLGDLDTPVRNLDRALRFYSESGDEEGAAYVHRLLGQILEEAGEHRRALAHRQRALSVFQHLGDDPARARAMNGVGWSHAQLGEYALALDYCSQAVELADQLGHPRSVAAAWDSIGFVNHAMHEEEAAERAYQRALVAWAEAGERYYEARTLEHLGNLRADSGDHAGAVAALRSALVGFTEIGASDAERLRTRLAALVGTMANSHAPTASIDSV